MKRDFELIRKILLAMEEAESGFAPRPLPVAGYDAETIGHHVYLMEQAGLVTAKDDSNIASESPVMTPLTITWHGHEYLDAVRSDTVWRKVKAQMKDRGVALTFDLIKQLAISILTQQAGLNHH